MNGRLSRPPHHHISILNTLYKSHNVVSILYLSYQKLVKLPL